MALQLFRAFRVSCVDASIEQATPRTRKRNKYGDIWSRLDDLRNFIVPTLGSKIVLLGDIDNFARVGIRIGSPRVVIFIGAR